VVSAGSVLCFIRGACAAKSLCKRGDEFDEGWLGVAPRESDVDDERDPGVVQGHAADLDDLDDALFCFL